MRNLLKDEILNLSAVSGRCDRAWEDELWLSSFYSCILLAPEEDLQSRKGTGICMYMKALERVKGTKQDLMQKSS